jgi:hypothetical protein
MKGVKKMKGRWKERVLGGGRWAGRRCKVGRKMMCGEKKMDRESMMSRAYERIRRGNVVVLEKYDNHDEAAEN